MLENDIAFTAVPPLRNDKSPRDDLEIFRRWFPSIHFQLPYLSDAHGIYRLHSTLVPDLRQKLAGPAPEHCLTTLDAYIFGL